MGPAGEWTQKLHLRGIGTGARRQTPQSGHAGRFRAGTVRADSLGEDRCR
jgi:hypothetical protein